jgi:hypothetical protein
MKKLSILLSPGKKGGGERPKPNQQSTNPQKNNPAMAAQKSTDARSAKTEE